MMQYRIGDIVPMDGRWRMTGAALPKPAWFALRVRSGQEAAAKAKMERHDIEVRYPVDTRVTTRLGKRVETSKATIPGLVYAKFEAEPAWHALRERRIVTGVVSRSVLDVDGTIKFLPIMLPGDIIARVMGLPMEAARLLEAKAEALRIRPGDRARLLDGPLEGFAVEVLSIRDKRVWWTSMWGKGEANLADMERLGE